MENIVIPQVHGNVAYPLDTRVILPIFIGKEDTIPTLQFAFFDKLPLLYLRACGDVEYRPCALIEDILYKRRTVELMHGEIRQHIPLPVV